MYLFLRNTDTRSCNHYGGGKAMSVTQPECVSGALVIHHAKRMRHFVFCALSSSTIFFHVV
jgi:hypothetical protein